MLVIAGIMLFLLSAITIINTAKIIDLTKELDNAELRAVTHFGKLNHIENILLQAEMDKTPAVIVLDKIREVITNQSK